MKRFQTLIFVEHEEVVTLGPKARREQTSVVDYPTFETDREGELHGMGPVNWLFTRLSSGRETCRTLEL